jgi:hypothetical protein
MPRFMGRNTSSTNYTVRAQNVGEAKLYAIAPLATFDFYVNDLEAADIRAQLATLSGVTVQEGDSTEQVKMATIAGTPATANTTAIHAAVASNAANAFPGPITNPVTPRNVTGVFAASYDGGNITIAGTDQFGADQTEVLTAVANSTVSGTKVFKTITSITKATVGATANAVSIGTGNKLGLGFNFLSGGILLVDGALDSGATFDATNDAVTPAGGLVPNGARAYKAMVSG